MPSIEIATLVTYSLISIISFSIGSMLGWSAAQSIDDVDRPMLRKTMAVVMLAAYVVSLMADIGVSGYQTPFLLHAIMGGIFGYLFSREDGVNINFARGE